MKHPIIRHKPLTLKDVVHFVEGRWHVAHKDAAGCFWSYRKRRLRAPGLWKGYGSGETAVPDDWGYSYKRRITAVRKAKELYNL